MTRQAEVLEISRGSVYYLPRPVSPADLAIMRRIDELHLDYPFAGSRMLRDLLRGEGVEIGRQHVATLMRRMGIEALYRRPNTSKAAPGHKIYPYLLRGLPVERPNQVWAMDITYIPMARGFVYLAAVVDWFSRRVLAWRLSITMEADFCVEAVEEAMARHGKPEIFNTDQGSQFTSDDFTGVLKAPTASPSAWMARARWRDNVFVERLWRSGQIRGGLPPRLRQRRPGARLARPLSGLLQPDSRTPTGRSSVKSPHNPSISTSTPCPTSASTRRSQSHYLSKRSRRQPSILAFLAQDADSNVFCYSNADLRKGEEADEIFRFIDFWTRQHGSPPQHLVFDSKLTTYNNLDRLDATTSPSSPCADAPRHCSRKSTTCPPPPGAPSISTCRNANTGPPASSSRRPSPTNDPSDSSSSRDLGHDLPTILLTNDADASHKQLITRYAKRMLIENALSDAVRFFHIDALSSAVGLKVDFDMALLVIASGLYRIMANRMRGYHDAQATTDLP